MEWSLGGGKFDGEKGLQITDNDDASATVLLGGGVIGMLADGTLHHGYGVHDYESAGWGLPDENRHAGISNILCVDGHVSPFITEEALYGGELVWIRTP